MRVHELKCDPGPFEDVVVRGFEIRKNDRGFDVGDVLQLRETTRSGADIAAGAPLQYTGRRHGVEVAYILRGPIHGLAEDWVIMSVRPALRRW